MERIFDLMEKLEKVSGGSYRVNLFNDFSGDLEDAFSSESVFKFDTKKELKKKLRKRIKEAKR